MSERKLVTFRTVQSLSPIVFTNAEGQQETASAIECAQLDGWQVVVKRGEFFVGQPAIYFEIDSVIPRKPWSEFLVDQNRPDKPIRLKTKKLKGVISQGLALPFDAFSDEEQAGIHKLPQDDTANFSELFGVTKYESPLPACLSGMAKGNFPWFIPKTDEERAANCLEKLRSHFGQPWYMAEKIDGSSMTVYLNEGEFGVCSRNLDLIETEGNAFWQMARQLNLEEKLRELHGLVNDPDNNTTGIFVQGELAGEGIQGNKLKLKGKQFFLFNYGHITKAGVSFADYGKLLNFAGRLEVQTVPILEQNLGLTEKTMAEITQMSVIRSSLNKDVWAEGVVLRPEINTTDDRFGRVSFKQINPNFLLKFSDD